jgi:hypothetical protein
VREGACIGYDATALDIEVDPQRRRFGSRKSDFDLQACVMIPIDCVPLDRSESQRNFQVCVCVQASTLKVLLPA